MSAFSDRAMALNALKYYQQASSISSVNALESFLDQKYPGFLDLWGRAVRNLNQSKVASALRDLADENGGKYPTRTDLNQVLLDVGGSISAMEAVKTGSMEAVKEVGEAAGNALKFGLPVLVIGLGLYFAWQAGVFRKGASHVAA